MERRGPNRRRSPANGTPLSNREPRTMMVGSTFPHGPRRVRGPPGGRSRRVGTCSDDCSIHSVSRWRWPPSRWSSSSPPSRWRGRRSAGPNGDVRISRGSGSTSGTPPSSGRPSWAIGSSRPTRSAPPGMTRADSTRGATSAVRAGARRTCPGPTTRSSARRSRRARARRSSSIRRTGASRPSPRRRSGRRTSSATGGRC